MSKVQAASPQPSSSSEGTCAGCMKLFTFLNLCRLMRFLGVVSCLAILVMFILMCKEYIEWMEDMDKSGQGSKITTRDVMNVISLIFHCLTALLFASFCSEMKGVLLYFSAFQNWMVLGLGLLYMSVLTFGELSGRRAYEDTDLEDAIEIVAWICLGVGVLYFILGMFGGKKVRERHAKLEMAKK